jgi:NTE family protein
LPGFFRPRIGAAALASGADPSLPSIYDTEPLRETLVELVDFDLINDGPTRLSVGAVEVKSGNFQFFDSRDTRIGPEHVMASGALPPGFPAVEIGGKHYWDGGIVSNTPLRHVVENLDDGAATIFQVDLFSARGELPRTLAQVNERERDIRYSSRTRAITDMLRERNETHRRLRALAAMLPASRRSNQKVQALLAGTNDAVITLVHLIHRHKGYETQTKDYEFSRDSMHEHWNVGLSDMSHSLRALSAAAPSAGSDSFRVFDYDPRSRKAGAR